MITRDDHNYIFKLVRNHEKKSTYILYNLCLIEMGLHVRRIRKYTIFIFKPYLMLNAVDRVRVRLSTLQKLFAGLFTGNV